MSRGSICLLTTIGNLLNSKEAIYELQPANYMFFFFEKSNPKILKITEEEAISELMDDSPMTKRV